jgi:hypothetical protein
VIAALIEGSDFENVVGKQFTRLAEEFSQTSFVHQFEAKRLVTEGKGVMEPREGLGNPAAGKGIQHSFEHVSWSFSPDRPCRRV